MNDIHIPARSVEHPRQRSAFPDNHWLDCCDAVLQASQFMLQQARNFGIPCTEFRELVVTGNRGPTWCRGVVTITQGSDPDVIAHELGHAFHEGMRLLEYPDVDGEAWADGFRFHVQSLFGESRIWNRGKTLNLRMLNFTDGSWTSFLNHAMRVIREHRNGPDFPPPAFAPGTVGAVQQEFKTTSPGTKALIRTLGNKLMDLRCPKCGASVPVEFDS